MKLAGERFVRGKVGMPGAAPAPWSEAGLSPHVGRCAAAATAMQQTALLAPSHCTDLPNALNAAVTLHPHGVAYFKNSEGSPYEDGTTSKCSVPAPAERL